MLDTRPLLLKTDFPPIARETISTLQVNLGYVCNLSCVHCHVNAGPSRTESMSTETIDQLIELIDFLRRAIEPSPRKRFRDADCMLRAFCRIRPRSLRYVAMRRKKAA